MKWFVKVVSAIILVVLSVIDIIMIAFLHGALCY